MDILVRGNGEINSYSSVSATGLSYKHLKFSMRVSPQALGNIIIETCVTIQEALRDFIKVSVLYTYLPILSLIFININ